MLVGLLRLRPDDRVHRGVERAAELGALTFEAALFRRLEPRVVGAARDRLDLAAERRDPPAVDHVRRHDLEIDHGAGRDVQRPDRAGLVRRVRVVELPVELVALDRDVDRVGRGGRGGDAGQLVEDEARDDGEDHDRECGPDQLEPRVPVNLRSLDLAAAAAAPVLPDEDDEQRLDEDEDGRREAEDEEVGVSDVRRVRGGGRDRSEAAVPGCSDASRRKREQHGENEGRQPAAQPEGIL